MSKSFTLVLTFFLVLVLAVAGYADLDYAIKLKTGELHPDRIKSTPSLATALRGKHILVMFYVLYLLIRNFLTCGIKLKVM